MQAIYDELFAAGLFDNRVIKSAESGVATKMDMFMCLPASVYPIIGPLMMYETGLNGYFRVNFVYEGRYRGLPIRVVSNYADVNTFEVKLDDKHYTAIRTKTNSHYEINGREITGNDLTVPLIKLFTR
jgi:hypothetical protein